MQAAVSAHACDPNTPTRGLGLFDSGTPDRYAEYPTNGQPCYELEPNRPHGFGTFSGSLTTPVIFKMWSTNIHQQLIGRDTKFQIVPDGRSYFINLTDGTIAESGRGDLKV
jgi:hypothetical protein